MKKAAAAIAVGFFLSIQSFAQAPGTADGQWHYLGGDAAHTRYSPADQIDADNFEDLEEAWVWNGASFNAASGRSTSMLAVALVIVAPSCSSAGFR